MAKFDPGWKGYSVWETGLPTLAGHPTYHINVIKLKWEITWSGGLPHLSGLPHLPGIPHLHVNRPLESGFKMSGHATKLTSSISDSLSRYSNIWIRISSRTRKFRPQFKPSRTSRSHSYLYPSFKIWFILNKNLLFWKAGKIGSCILGYLLAIWAK